jgi:hypothetical protein
VNIKKKEGKKNKAQAVKESADLKQIKSLKLSKNMQVVEHRNQ